AVEILRCQTRGDFDGEQLSLVGARNGASMNFVEHSEGIIRHSCDDIDLCQIEASGERLWFENSDSLELIGCLPIKGGSGEDEAFFEAKSGLIKWAIVSHDIIPDPVSAKGILKRL